MQTKLLQLSCAFLLQDLPWLLYFDMYLFYCIYLNFCKRWSQPSSNDEANEMVRCSNIHGTVCTEIVTTNSNSTSQENSENPHENMTLATKPHVV